MAWQDITITLTVLALNYALIPQIIKSNKEKKSLISIQTATITTLGMGIISIIYLTLNLIFSCIINFTATILWATILIQSIIYKNN